jgi:hypothetical protein
VAQTLTDGNSLACTGKTRLIDMFLKGYGLPPMCIHEWQFFCKRTATVFSMETTSHEMQKSLFAPYIQVANAPMFFLMDCR